MADKDIDLDLDDGFDDFEFDDLDTGIDPPKDDRSPVRKLSTSFVSGVADDMRDKHNLKRRLSESLPEGYGKAVDLTDDVAGEAKDLYNTVVRETSSGIRDFKKASEQVLRRHEDKMPRGLADRLQKLVKTEEARKELSAAQIQDQEIANSLATIFDAQNEKEHEEKQREKSEEIVRDKIEEGRHKTTVGQLDAIRESANRLVSYQDNVTAKFQRKSLELQYRQFFVARDQLKVAEDLAKNSKEALAAISKNTALPEYRKTELTEASGQMFRDRMLSSAQSQISGYFGNFFGKFRENLQGAVQSRARGVGDNLSTVAGQMEMARDAQEAGVDIDPMSIGGQMVGGQASNFMMKRLTPKIQQWANDNENVVANGAYLTHLLNLPRQANEYARSNTEGGPIRRYFEQLLKDIIPQYQLNRVGGDAPILNAQDAVPFTSLTRRSITEIIPGYLSRIHQEIRILRTGDESIQPISYNLDRGEFTTRDRVKQDVARRLFSNDRMGQSQNTINDFLDITDPNSQLSDEGRRQLVKTMLEQSAEGQMFDPAKYAKSSFYTGDMAEETREELADFFRDQFNIDEEGDVGTDNANKIRIAKASNRFNKLATGTVDPGDLIRGYLETGQREALVDLGLIQQVDSVDRINYDRIWDILQSGVVDDEDPHGGNRGPSAPYNTSSFPDSGGPFGGPLGYSGLNSRYLHNPNSATAGHSSESTRDLETKIHQLTELYRENSRELLMAVRDIRDVHMAEEEESYGEDPVIQAIRESDTRDLNEEQLEVLGLILARLEMGVNSLTPGEGGQDGGMLSTTVGGYLQKARGLAGRAGKGLMNYYGKVFGAAGDLIKGAGSLGRGTMTRAGDFLRGGKYRLKDVYVEGSYSPALLANKLKAGEYRDQVTGDVITKLEDLRNLKGPVVDAYGNVVLSLEDVAKGVFTLDGGFNFRGGLRFLGRMYGKLFSPVTILKDGAQRIFKMAKDHVERVRDVYVKGEDKPRLLATVMRNGGYVNKEGKSIRSFKDIDGDIYDLNGNLVLSLDDMRQGLTDAKGRSLDFARRLGQRLKGAVEVPLKMMSWGLDKAKGALEWGKNAFSNLFSGIGDAVNSGRLTKVNEKSHDVLVDIREILKERLPDQSKNPWDTDGDGMRDGGWRAQFAQREEEREAEEKAARAEAGQEKHGSLFGRFGEMLSGALGRFLPGGGNDEGGGGADIDIYGDMGGRDRNNRKNRNRRPRGRFGRLWQGAKNLGRGAVNRGGRAASWLRRTTAARTALQGGSMLATKVGAGGLLAKAGAGIGTAAAAIAGAPAWLVGGVVVGTALLGWMAYRHFSKDKMGSIGRLRMLQYGVQPDNEDHVAKVAMLEDKLAPYVQESGGQWTVNASDLDVQELFEDFGVDLTDPYHTQQFERWMVQRFLPIYLSYKGALGHVSDGVALKDIDDDLDRTEKRDLIAILKADRAGNPDPYAITDSPFESDQSLSVTSDEIDQAFAVIDEEVKEEEDERSRRRASSSVLGADLSTRNLRTLGDPERVREFTGAGDPEDSLSVARTVSSVSESSGRGGRMNLVAIQGPVYNAMVDGERVISSLDAIRFRVYGLKDLEHRKVAALRRLETEVRQAVEFSSEGVPEFTGDIDAIYRRNLALFGQSPNDETARRRWKTWFRTRFLNTYLIYLSGLKLVNPNLDAAKNQILSRPNDALSIAEQLIGLMVNYRDEEVSVWEVTASPWLGYELNTDADSIAPNLNVLESRSEEKTLAEERSNSSTSNSEQAAAMDTLSAAQAAQRRLSERRGSPNNASVTTTSGTNSSSNRNNLSQTQTSRQDPLPPSRAHSRATLPTGEGYTTVAGALVESNITDPEEQAMAIAQLGHESGNFSQLEENLNYSADALLRVFGKYFPTRAEAERYARNPEAIANRVYGGRMGNRDPGDGWKYRGRGFIQLTGRDNYEMVSNALGVDYINNPDLLTEPEHAARASLWWWKNRRGLRPAAQEGDVRTSTRLINGGYNGLADRQSKFRRYLPRARDGEITREGMEAAVEVNGTSPLSPMEESSMGEGMGVDPSGALALTSTQSETLTSTSQDGGDSSSGGSGGKAVSSSEIGPLSNVSVPSIDSSQGINEATGSGDSEAAERQRIRRRAEAEARDRQGQQNNEEMSRSMTGVENLLRDSLTAQQSIDERLKEVVELIRGSREDRQREAEASRGAQESQRTSENSTTRTQRQTGPLMEAAVNLARRQAS